MRGHGAGGHRRALHPRRGERAGGRRNGPRVLARGLPAPPASTALKSGYGVLEVFIQYGVCEHPRYV